MSKKITLLTLASEATEITVEGHRFFKENGKWKIWFKLQNLVYQAITEKSEDRTRYKIGLRTWLSGDLEIFYCRSLVVAYQVAKALEEEAFNEARKLNEPVDVVLFCPNCGDQHIDQAEPDNCEKCGFEEIDHYEDSQCRRKKGCDNFTAWLNPPHKTHRCHSCNQTWRPFDFPTNGVLKVHENIPVLKILKIARSSPALNWQSDKKGFLYPKEFCGRVPLKIRLTKRVTSDLPASSPEMSAEANKAYFVWVNSYGAVAAILPDGKTLGLKPKEFEVIEWH